MFEAKIVADSISPEGIRLTSFQLQYPRIILAEVNTHRVFSRSSASSRAIPIEKMIHQVIHDPAMPVWWGKNQAGMQAPVEVDDTEAARMWWVESARVAVEQAKKGVKLGLHKQIVNRILEPWQWTKTILTSTEWDNFWDLRCHTDAQPEFKYLAEMMKVAYDEQNEWDIWKMKPRQWHLPYVTLQERANFSVEDTLKFSTARCARVSFANHDKTDPVPEKDIELHDKLVVQKPAHASPAEHMASPDVYWKGLIQNTWGHPELHGNFRGWNQYRHVLEKGINVNNV